MLEQLKQDVWAANLLLVKYNLVLFTWGNVSGIDRARGLVVIKPSGVEYDALRPEDLPVLDLDGNVVEGNYRPSSDTPTHLALYRAFPTVGGITHTHSTYATAYAQAGREIKPYGTTHADYFDGTIPCTRAMTEAEIADAYEYNTGLVIAETFADRNPDRMPAVLVRGHAPFTWGKDAKQSVEKSVILEEVARMAQFTELLSGADAPRMQEALLRKHFDRKHGPGAYYGQGGAQ